MHVMRVLCVVWVVGCKDKTIHAQYSPDTTTAATAPACVQVYKSVATVVGSGDSSSSSSITGSRAE